VEEKAESREERGREEKGRRKRVRGKGEGSGGHHK
jgi:hypothetical protein